MQTGNTDKMIFNVFFIVSYLSKFMTLQAGDIITTGTPPGVGMGKKPQVFLKAGDSISPPQVPLRPWTGLRHRLGVAARSA